MEEKKLTPTKVGWLAESQHVFGEGCRYPSDVQMATFWPDSTRDERIAARQAYADAVKGRERFDSLRPVT